MTYLLLVLASIALLDSTSMVPVAVFAIAVILAGRNPIGAAIGFLLGIFLTYFLFGLLLLFGLNVLLERIEPALERWWNCPSSAELLLQLFVGIIILVTSWKVGSSQGKPKEQQLETSLSPSRWAIYGAVLILGGAPGAVPYLGAVDQILRSEIAHEQAIAALAFYNLVFIVPLVILFLVPRMFPAQSEAFFIKLSEFLNKHGPSVLTIILAILGHVLIVDAIAFYYGYPILPVSNPCVSP